MALALPTSHHPLLLSSQCRILPALINNDGRSDGRPWCLAGWLHFQPLRSGRCCQSWLLSASGLRFLRPRECWWPAIAMTQVFDIRRVPHYRHFTVQAYFDHITPSDRSILVLHLSGPVLVKRLFALLWVGTRDQQIGMCWKGSQSSFQKDPIVLQQSCAFQNPGCKTLKDCLLVITLIVLTFGGVTYVLRFAGDPSCFLGMLVSDCHKATSYTLLGYTFWNAFWIELGEVPFQRVLEGIREPSKYSIWLPIIENH